MKQLLQFRVTDKTVRSTVIIRCEIDLTSGLSKRVTYYAPRNLLRSFASRTISSFVRKLAITGTNNSQIRGNNDFAEKIQHFLENEFGRKFKVVNETVPLASRQIGFRPNFSASKPISNPAKKAKASEPSRSVAINPSNSYKSKKEEWSNFTGDQVQRKPRPRMPEKVASKKLAVKKPALKKKAMKKVDGGTTSTKVPVKKIAAKKAVAKKKVGGGATTKKASAKKVVAKKTTVKKIVAKKAVIKKPVTKKATPAKKAKKGETVNNSDYNTVKVFYATDRKKTSPLSSEPFYSGKRNDTNALEYGYCKVSVPKTHKLGKIERPSWFQNVFLVNPENPAKHISILEAKNQSQEDFITDLMTKIKGSSDKDALIFIHGFNVSFEESIWHTAQITYDLNYKGAPITYSWPSRGVRSKTAYMTDEQNVDWTVPHLTEFLINILSNPKLEKLHLMGHSMGTRVLTKAIMSLKLTKPELTSKISQIILAAPDINATVFVDSYAPAIYQSAEQITLYASSKDLALYWSTRYRTEDKRAGQSGDDIVIVNGVETVDASKVDCSLIGHGYFTETRELINDIFQIIKHSFTPPQRNLMPVIIQEKGQYWQFPEAM